jgi:aminomethyltransferase
MKLTPLHANHIALNAKMGEFAGYDMPLYYGEGVMAEHHWVRNSCGLFDVSHMGQAMIRGPKDGGVGGRDALDFIQTITPSSFEKLALGRTKYSVLTNLEGGIIDDLMITHADDNAYHLVLNAGCKDKDIDWITSHLPDSLTFTQYDGWALLALQGQKAEAALRDVVDMDASDMAYMEMRDYSSDTHGQLYISRLGYTGEDGFEIAVEGDKASALWDALIAHDAVKPIGLAARDSLRLEMGYALYGHDIDATTSPIEGGIGWVLSKTTSGYFGEERIKNERENGAPRARIALVLTDKGVAREGAEIHNANGEKIGVVTSGGPSPTLSKSIAMGFVDPAYVAGGNKADAPVFINVRSRNLAAERSALPFYPAQTKSMKKKAA